MILDACTCACVFCAKAQMDWPKFQFLTPSSRTVAKWGVVALTVNLQFLFLWNEVLPSFQNTSENCNTIRYVFHEQNSRWLIFRKFISCELDTVVWKQFCTKVSLNKYVYTVYKHDQYKLGKGLKIFKITFPMK